MISSVDWGGLGYSYSPIRDTQKCSSGLPTIGWFFDAAQRNQDTVKLVSRPLAASNFRKQKYPCGAGTPVSTKHLHNIYTMSAQLLRRCSNTVQMFYKCFVFSGTATMSPLVSAVSSIQIRFAYDGGTVQLQGDWPSLVPTTLTHAHATTLPSKHDTSV